MALIPRLSVAPSAVGAWRRRSGRCGPWGPGKDGVDSYVGPWGIQIQLMFVFVVVVAFVVVVVFVFMFVSVFVSVSVSVFVSVSVCFVGGNNNDNHNNRRGGLERTLWTHMLDPGGSKFN